jgi:hypothetical protein
VPSEFLRARYKEFLTETSGDTTAQFIPFNRSSVDALTGDVVESSAYTATPIPLPARIDFFPTRALRALAGLDISFEVVIRLSTEDLADAGITEIKVGDAFILPDMTNKRYATKVIKKKQSGTDFIEHLIFASRNVKHRG